MASFLSLYRLASGLRWRAGTSVKNTFIHYDDAQEDAEERDEVVRKGRKYVTNIIDAAPAGWSQHEELDVHIQNIVDLHRPRAQGAAAPCASPRMGREGSGGGRGVTESATRGSRCRSSRRAASRSGGRGSGREVGEQAGEQAREQAGDQASEQVAAEAPGRRPIRRRTRAAAPSAEAVRAADEPVASVGSARHAAGRCKPCAWNRKAGGCFKGAACEFCHTCEDGAVQQRKKERRLRVQACRRRAAERQAAAASREAATVSLAVNGVAAAANRDSAIVASRDSAAFAGWGVAEVSL